MTQTSDWSSTPTDGTSEDSAKEKATQVVQAAKDSGAEVAQTAAEQAKTVATEASHQARDLTQQARGQLREQASTQQQKAVSSLRALVEELQAMAHNSGQSGPATEVVHQLADRGRQAADWIEQRQPGDLLEEFRRLGRRRAGAFLAGAAVAGALAGRLTRGVTAANSDDSTQPENHRPATPPSPYDPYDGVAGDAAAAGVAPPPAPYPAPYPTGTAPEPIPIAPASELPPDPGGWR